MGDSMSNGQSWSITPRLDTMTLIPSVFRPVFRYSWHCALIWSSEASLLSPWHGTNHPTLQRRQFVLPPQTEIVVRADLRGEPCDVIRSIRLCKGGTPALSHSQFDDRVAHKPSTTHSTATNSNAKRETTFLNESINESSRNWSPSQLGAGNTGGKGLALGAVPGWTCCSNLFWQWQGIWPCSADPLYSGPKLCSKTTYHILSLVCIYIYMYLLIYRYRCIFFSP